MKISKEDSKRHDWREDKEVRSWNYKLPGIGPYQSIVRAEIDGEHGEVNTENVERVYYILSGNGEFDIQDEGKTQVEKGDVITVPPHRKYNYRNIGDKPLEILLFMELWEN